ncbi:hypothetical protein Tdes44962_MAKER02602 [Teratosphaeria destructans]|uniref:Uncharacterized protein n=1 Tax=Teratosphaeria destructans TaxID=418781 RepID=A0A9W7W2P4_9PEZI|nr:hypothetical protein Tdes44962_MAKER02602 [Teratosphaeria destructans]
MPAHGKCTIRRTPSCSFAFHTPWTLTIAQKKSQKQNRKVIYFLFFSASRMTFLTIFCSSIRKARTTRSLTQLAQRDPP